MAPSYQLNRSIPLEVEDAGILTMEQVQGVYILYVCTRVRVFDAVLGRR